MSSVETSVGNGRLLAYLAEHAEIVDRRYHDDSRVTLECRIPQPFLSKIYEEGATVTLHSAPRPEDLQDIAASA